MNPLVPLSILLLIPITAVLAVLFTDTGIEPLLFKHAVVTFAILFVVGGAMSFAASKLADRSNA